MSDLVSGLLARLDEIEKVAKAAPFDPYKIHVDNPEDGPHIRWHDPASVLRLCRAHRDIIDMYGQAKDQPVAESVRHSKGRGLDHASAMGRLTTLGLVLQALARGLGVEEQSSE